MSSIESIYTTVQIYLGYFIGGMLLLSGLFLYVRNNDIDAYKRRQNVSRAKQLILSGILVIALSLGIRHLNKRYKNFSKYFTVMGILTR